MAVDLAALKTELATDPALIGYAGNNPDQKATLINAVGSATAAISRSTVTNQEVIAEVRQGEWHAMGVDVDGEGPSRQRLFQVLMTVGGVGAAGLDWSDTQVRNLIRSCFPAPSAPNTRTAIIALETIPATVATRAEELFGQGVVVTALQIVQAEALP